MLMPSSLRPGRARRFRVYLGLALLMTLLAWLFSALPPGPSSEQSGWLRDLLERMLGIQVPELLLRKAAHFTEYALIGLFAGLALSQLHYRALHVPLLLMICLMIALIDESIQLFSGRGPAIVDVWIDGAGALCGMALALGLAVLGLGRRRF